MARARGASGGAPSARRFWARAIVCGSHAILDGVHSGAAAAGGASCVSRAGRMGAAAAATDGSTVSTANTACHGSTYRSAMAAHACAARRPCARAQRRTCGDDGALCPYLPSVSGKLTWRLEEKGVCWGASLQALRARVGPDAQTPTAAGAASALARTACSHGERRLGSRGCVGLDVTGHSATARRAPHGALPACSANRRMDARGRAR